MLIMKKTYFYRYVCMAVLLFGGTAISLSVGSADIGVIGSIKLALSGIPGIKELIDISQYSSMQRYIILQVRLPRVLLAGLVGAGLSAAGFFSSGTGLFSVFASVFVSFSAIVFISDFC